MKSFLLFLRKHWISLNVFVAACTAAFAFFLVRMLSALFAPDGTILALSYGIAVVTFAVLLAVSVRYRSVVKKAFSKFPLYGYVKNTVLMKKNDGSEVVALKEELLTEDEVMERALSIVEWGNQEELPFVLGTEEALAFDVHPYVLLATVAFEKSEWSETDLFDLGREISRESLATHVNWGDVVAFVEKKINSSLQSSGLLPYVMGEINDNETFGAKAEKALKEIFSHLGIKVISVKSVVSYNLLIATPSSYENSTSI